MSYVVVPSLSSSPPSLALRFSPRPQGISVLPVVKMKAVFFSVAFFAAASMAQQTTACGAAYIVDACLGTENGKLATCGINDYVCKCNAYANIITCFNNCPNDPRKRDQEGQQQIFCGYASQFPSSTTKAAAATGTTKTTETTVAAATTDASESSAAAGSGKAASGSATNSAANPAKTNSAADLALNAGGILAAVAGVVAAVL